MEMNIKLPIGYKLLANYKNEVVLAEAENKEIPEPYVTWLVSNGSDIHTGCYFSDISLSQLSFSERAFGIRQIVEEVSLAERIAKNRNLRDRMNAISDDEPHASLYKRALRYSHNDFTD